MIREATPADTDEMVALWLAASRQAHSFVPFEYWSSRASDMRDVYLPNSETYVAVSGDAIRGFVSLRDDDLAALFVEPASQGQGIGSCLLEFAQSIRTNLMLTVYLENERARSFYQHHGFEVTEERLDADTARREAVMRWNRTTDRPSNRADAPNTSDRLKGG